MSWSAWIGLAFAVLVQIVLIARGWQWVKSAIGHMQKTIERQQAIIEKHEKHFMDMEIHWTSRERDALVAQLERLSANTKRVEELVQESLTERADVIKVIAALMDRKERQNGPEKS